MAAVTQEIAIRREALEACFSRMFGECRVVNISALGSGVHGTGYLVALDTPKGERNFVLKNIAPEGLGHDYPSDRAAVLLLALDGYGRLLHHVRAVDVLSLRPDGSLEPIGGGADYFLVMEEAKGVTYFRDLEMMSKKEALDGEDKDKIKAMADYLSRIHAVKKDSRVLYLRRLRDIIGHGECLMGVFDSYPEGVLSYKEMADVEKLCIGWRAGLKDKWHRLSQVHGDFHPGNIWWRESVKDEKTNSIMSRLCLLDRSRGLWGEPADDLTALSINYLFFSIKHFDAFRGPYLESFKLFFDEYIRLTGDDEVLDVLAPFFAFRGAVVANPVFYPETSKGQRNMIFDFVKKVLSSDKFEPGSAEKYVS